MTAFTSFSHGTQDLYPTFLLDHGLSDGHVGLIAAIGNVGAFVGGICCGALSERLGRRKTILLAALFAIPMVPLWAWSHSMAMLAAGGFLMQFMVQGAWGIIPAHLNELAPGPVRAIFPGVAYQLGNLLSSRNAVFQAAYANTPQRRRIERRSLRDGGHRRRHRRHGRRAGARGQRQRSRRREQRRRPGRNYGAVMTT